MGKSISTTSNAQITINSQRKVIDTTEADDKEAVLISAFDLMDIACDLSGAITALNDIGALLHLIYSQEITPQQAISMARLSHDAADTWANLLCSQLNIINEPLTLTSFGKEVAE